MSYKSKMNESGSPAMLDINYLPAISKEHPYSLATMYPYATKQNGEAGFKAEVIYTIPKKTKIGGEYGTTIEVDYAYANSIKKEPISPAIPIDSTGTDGYQAKFLSIGDIPFYRDLDIMIDRKFNKKLKVKLAYFNQTYNLNVIEDDIFNDEEMVYANIGVIDLTYKFLQYIHSLRWRHRVFGQRRMKATGLP